MSKKCETGKFCFTSRKGAKRAFRSSDKGFRFRVYRCSICGDHHITNSHKAKWGGGRVKNANFRKLWKRERMKKLRMHEIREERRGL